LPQRQLEFNMPSIKPIKVWLYALAAWLLIAGAAGAAPTGSARRQSCKVLRATPRSAATCRCGCPAAQRVSVI
jgi:hypothetical protein